MFQLASADATYTPSVGFSERQRKSTRGDWESFSARVELMSYSSLLADGPSDTEKHAYYNGSNQ
jgi:hypothetical protein